MHYPRRFVATAIAAICLTLNVQAQTLHSPESVTIDKLGYMSTFPPADSRT